MITHVIVELKYPVEDEYFHMDTVFPNEYYGYGTPLIRCKDCKYSTDEYGDGDCYCDLSVIYIGKDWNHFCSWAERK